MLNDIQLQRMLALTTTQMLPEFVLRWPGEIGTVEELTALPAGPMRTFLTNILVNGMFDTMRGQVRQSWMGFQPLRQLSEGGEAWHVRLRSAYINPRLSLMDAGSVPAREDFHAAGRHDRDRLFIWQRTPSDDVLIQHWHNPGCTNGRIVSNVFVRVPYNDCNDLFFCSYLDGKHDLQLEYVRVPDRLFQRQVDAA